MLRLLAIFRFIIYKYRGALFDKNQMINTKSCGTSRGLDFRPNNFRGVLTQFCRVPKGEDLICLEFPGKVRNLENPGFNSKNYVPPSPQ